MFIDELSSLITHKSKHSVNMIYFDFDCNAPSAVLRFSIRTRPVSLYVTLAAAIDNFPAYMCSKRLFPWTCISLTWKCDHHSTKYTNCSKAMSDDRAESTAGVYRTQ